MYQFGPWTTYQEEETFGADANYEVTARNEPAPAGIQKGITHSFNQGFYQDEDGQLSESNDSGSAASTSSLTASVSSTDAGSSFEQGGISIVVVSDDDGSVTENLVCIDIFDTDTANVVDGQTTTKIQSLNSSDSFSVEELEIVDGAQLFEEDSATALDITVAVTKPETQESAFAESVEELKVVITDTDSASVADEGIMSLFLDDSATATEVPEVAVVKVSSDSGLGYDPESLKVVHTENEDILYAENFLREAQAVRFDLANAYELQSVSVEQEASDLATAVETFTLGRNVEDFGSAVETEEVVVSRISSDSGSAIEQSAVSLPGEQSNDTSPYYAQILASNPVYFWRLGEINGNAIYDKQRRATGILFGTLSPQRGLVAGENTAFGFNGANRVQFGDLLFNYKGMSVEFVCKNVSGQIISKDNEFDVVSDGTSMTFRLTNEADEDLVVLSHAETSGHFVFSNNSGVAQLFHNGVLVDEYISNVSVKDSAGSVVIGSNGASGVIDDVAIYDYPLGAQTVLRHYYASILNNDVAEAIQGFRPVIHIPLNGSLSEYNGYYKTQQEEDFYTVSYVEGSGKQLVQPSLAMVGDEEIFYEVPPSVFNVENYTFGYSFKALAAGSGTTRWLYRGVGGFTFYVSIVDKFLINTGEDATSLVSVPTEEWIHSIVTIKNGELTLYFNGEVKQERTFDGTLTNESGLISLCRTNDSNMLVENFFFTDRALSAPEVKALYNTMQHARNDNVPAVSDSIDIEDDQFEVYQYEVVLNTG